MRNSIIIVGGGYSGTVLAATLLRRPPPRATDIFIIERSGVFGRGVAYAAREYPFLLNVPAGRLSADSSDPLGFLRFAQMHHPHADAEDFLPRSLYGEYMADFLNRAEHAAPAHVHLERVHDEVMDIAPVESGGFSVRCAGRGALAADSVVLALGNPAAPEFAWAGALRGNRGWHADPWNLPRNLGPAHTVLIIGNGLTMADAATALARDPDQSPSLHSISRRGLTPREQTAFRPRAVNGSGEHLLSCAHSLRSLLRNSRALARDVEQLGGDWREAVTFIRNIAPRLWERMPATEQRRFVRHLQPQWDVHRHRLPPELSRRVANLQAHGTLQVHAGRVRHAAAEGDMIRVAWQPRGSAALDSMTVDVMVNAAGPDYALERSREPLIKALRERDLISADALQLGMRTAPFGACMNAAGEISNRLFYLGPMLRAMHWEATAAAELRTHAELLAGHFTSD